MLRALAKDHAAQSDLIGIWVYTCEYWGETQADRYLDSIEQGIRNLVRSPESGRKRSTLREGYWSKRINRHVVFYTFTDSELRVRRVLHGVMDPELHL